MSPDAAATPPAPAPEPAVDLRTDGQRWDDASKEVRQTAKWTITAVAAAGAVIFGAGPVLTIGDLSGDHLPFRLCVVVVSALLGVGGLATLIWRTARVLVPYEVTWNTLPDSLKNDIRNNSAMYLPEGLDSVDELRAQRAQTGVILRTQLALLPEAESRLARAEADPRQADKVPGLVEEVDDRRIVVAAAQGNQALYDTIRRDIFAKARYTHVHDLFVGGGGRFVGAGLAVVLGGIGVLMAVNYAPVDDDPPAGPRPAILVPREDEASDELWRAAGLSDCDDAAGAVAVLVDSGAGTPGDPDVVQPVSTADACAGLRFTVVDEVASVVFPEPRELDITYEPLAEEGDQP
jgi:hypothetical protein